MFEPPYELYRRPRLLNPLHALGLFKAHSQTNADELACLARHAAGHRVAVEFGTYMGVSAAVIAGALAADGVLYCVDPWELHHGRENPSWTICRRELQRSGQLERVRFLQGYSHEMEERLPAGVDFMFVDGDHSYEGIERDWAIVLRRLAPGGIICLHDTTRPAVGDFPNHESVKFFEQHIRHHQEFEWLECCRTMNVLKRRSTNGG